MELARDAFKVQCSRFKVIKKTVHPGERRHMNGIIDADTHISEGEAMWKMMGADFLRDGPSCSKFLRIPGMATAMLFG